MGLLLGVHPEAPERTTGFFACNTAVNGICHGVELPGFCSLSAGLHVHALNSSVTRFVECQCLSLYQW